MTHSDGSSLFVALLLFPSPSLLLRFLILILHLLHLLPPPTHTISSTARRTRRKESLLILHQQPRNTRTRQRAQDARKQRRYRNPADVRAPSGRDLGQHADLLAERADVAEAAEGVGGD